MLSIDTAKVRLDQVTVVATVVVSDLIDPEGKAAARTRIVRACAQAM